MASQFHHVIVFLGLVFATSCLAQPSFRPKALLLPVRKDRSTRQHLTRINQRTPLVPISLVVDLGGKFMWVDCQQTYISSTYRPARCGSALCSLANSGVCSGGCDPIRPGCNNNTCTNFPENTVTRHSADSDLGMDAISIQSTEGKNPGRVVLAPRVPVVCGYTSLLERLASGAQGMAGLGRTKVSLPVQFAAAFSFRRKFAVCLSSSTNSNGVVFFGDVSQYTFLENVVVFSSSLIYTPLFINPISTATTSVVGEASAEYFIGVKSIRVNGKSVPVNKTLLSIEPPNSVGGTKISTVNPYTVLESSIHKAVLGAFVAAIPHVRRVAAVARFSACFRAGDIASIRDVPGVPQIELVLQSESVVWRILEANSMVDVGNDTLCLGFVDGGVEPRTSIVIGGHQIEDNLLEFDLDRSRMGFSSNLLDRQSSCASFNFTSNV